MRSFLFISLTHILFVPTGTSPRAAPLHPPSPIPRGSVCLACVCVCVRAREHASVSLSLCLSASLPLCLRFTLSLLAVGLSV